MYDQKFEAYSRIWEKVQKIEQEFERTAVRPDYHDALANLKKEIEHFYQFCRSKYLVVPPHGDGPVGKLDGKLLFGSDKQNQYGQETLWKCPFGADHGVA